MSEDTMPEFDSNRIAELIEKHRTAPTRRAQRKIENEVLVETVWADDYSVRTEEVTYTLNGEELRTVYQALLDADGNEVAQEILNKKLVEGMSILS